MMLRSMLIYRQNKRVMDQQVLESEWMQDWGQPALEQSRSTFTKELWKDGPRDNQRVKYENDFCKL